MSVLNDEMIPYFVGKCLNFTGDDSCSRGSCLTQFKSTGTVDI